MKTKELIAALQKEDPEGEAEVIAGNTPIYFVERQPAYYDGPLQVLVQDPKKVGKEWSVIGYKVTRSGLKVRLHLMDLADVMLDMPDVPVDLDDLWHLSQERVGRIRAEPERRMEG